MPAGSQKGIFPSFKAVAVLTAIVFITLFAIVPFVIALFTATRSAAQQTDAGPDEASPIFGVTIPRGYRQWELIAPAEEAAPLDELRAILGNKSAVDAYRSGTLPFPDGTVLVNWPGNTFSRPSSDPLLSPARGPRSRSWSRTPANMPRQAVGVLAVSSMADRPTRRSTAHV
jgi:hypothetical protein